MAVTAAHDPEAAQHGSVQYDQTGNWAPLAHGVTERGHPYWRCPEFECEAVTHV